MIRGRVLRVGTVTPNEAGDWDIADWVFSGADFGVYLDLATGEVRIGGHSVQQLRCMPTNESIQRHWLEP